MAARPDDFRPRGMLGRLDLSDDLSGRLVVKVDRPHSAAAATVRVRGEVDMATAPVMQHRLETLLGTGIEDLTLDLSAVPFCDVAGLTALLRIQCQLSMRGGRLKLLEPCPSLQTMIATLGLDDRLHPSGHRADRAGEDATGTG